MKDRSIYAPSETGRVLSRSLVDLAVPMPGEPDVTKATDERVFDAAALREMHNDLDRLDRLGIYRRPR